MGAILYKIAIILYRILRPLLIIYAVIRLTRFRKWKRIYIFDFKLVSKYFGDLALAYDRLGNVMIAPAANDFMIKKTSKHLYGNGLETISHATGINYLDMELEDFGYFISHGLDAIDKNHVENAAENKNK